LIGHPKLLRKLFGRRGLRAQFHTGRLKLLDVEFRTVWFGGEGRTGGPFFPPACVRTVARGGAFLAAHLEVVFQLEKGVFQVTVLLLKQTEILIGATSGGRNQAESDPKGCN